MIPLLRAVALSGNAALFAALPLLLGFPWVLAAAVVVALFALSHWACGRAPAGAPAPPEVHEAATRAAGRMGAPLPRYVRSVPGWTAAAVRSGRGYGLLLGVEVAPRHREAVLAHEMAHHVAGDLFWEPFTDGPARVLLSAAGGHFRVTALPFLAWAAPLAKLTELNADRLAADAFPDYAGILREVAHTMGVGAGVLYPSLGQRARHTARDSKGSPRTP
jgi:hypothetical protein